MAWLITGAVTLQSGGGGGSGDGFIPWYIKDGEVVTIPSCKEMAVHGDLVIEGTLIINTDARLRLEP